MRPRRGHSVIRGFRSNGFERIAESARACCASKPPYPAASPIPGTQCRDQCLFWLTEVEMSQMAALRRPPG
jgi:hypothetical protein